MDRWKELLLDTLAQSIKANTQVKKWQGDRTGIFEGVILREISGYYVCSISTETYIWETEPLRNVTSENFTTGDRVLIVFTQSQTGYIILRL